MRLTFCSCHRASWAAPDLGAGTTRGPVSGGPVDKELLHDLMIGSRICAMENVFDAYGHLSMRHPHAPDRFLMTKSVAPALATVEDIVELDLSGHACEGEMRPLFLERFIHGEIYRLRPDVNAIVHSHSPSVIPFSVTDVPMKAMFHTAAFIAEGVPVFDIWQHFGETDMLIDNVEKGRALAQTLGSCSVCLMRAHGSVAVGPSVKHAVFRAVYTEINARLQKAAMGMSANIDFLRVGEGALADTVNIKGVSRPWDLWKTRVLRDLKAG
jgi:HCOMODA/2-hydroxy-3-carboxy-muconic semialdehyde decarboxylase